MREVSHKQELTRWIMQVCASCPHATSQGRGMACDRKRSQCHSKRVKKWLKQLEEMEVTNEPNS